MIIFDIGCCWGLWIEANYNENDTFIGVEANPSAYLMAKERLKERKNVIIKHHLLSDVNGEYLDFRIAESSVGEVSSASKAWVERSRHIKTEKWMDPIKIKSITIDELIRQYGEPSQIKIDVEGYEFNVIRGLSKAYGLLMFEFAEEQKDETIQSIHHLVKIGYKYFCMTHGDDYIFRPTSYVSSKEILLLILQNLNSGRQEAWGMIYAK